MPKLERLAERVITILVIYLTINTIAFIIWCATNQCEHEPLPPPPTGIHLPDVQPEPESMEDLLLGVER